MRHSEHVQWRISAQRGGSPTIDRDHRSDQISTDFIFLYFHNIKEMKEKLNNIDR